uniref:Uncharacterized protein n=1 Tax=Anguilla anguilla TaxID=7936 RepID=A0A0E9TAT4_ANGAN
MHIAAFKSSVAPKDIASVS